jgi:hypothetical protein
VALRGRRCSSPGPRRRSEFRAPFTHSPFRRAGHRSLFGLTVRWWASRGPLPHSLALFRTASVQPGASRTDR